MLSAPLSRALHPQHHADCIQLGVRSCPPVVNPPQPQMAKSDSSGTPCALSQPQPGRCSAQTGRGKGKRSLAGGREPLGRGGWGSGVGQRRAGPPCLCGADSDCSTSLSPSLGPSPAGPAGGRWLQPPSAAPDDRGALLTGDPSIQVLPSAELQATHVTLAPSLKVHSRDPNLTCDQSANYCLFWASVFPSWQGCPKGLSRSA